MVRQPGIEPICDRNERVGIDLHTWQKEIDFVGAKISNVVMSGFANDPNCAKPSSLRFDKFVSRKNPSQILQIVVSFTNVHFHLLVTDFKAGFI
jgi:hypothetical protein